MTKESLYGYFGPLFTARGYVPLPVKKGDKAPVLRDWTKSATLSPGDRAASFRQYADCNIGLLAGTPLPNGRIFGFVDVDHPGFVEFVRTVLAPFESGKVGAKGLTIFCQVDIGIRSLKVRPRTARAPAVEVFATTGMTVVPPSMHPSGNQYRWTGTSLLQVTPDRLPVLNAERCAMLEMVVRNEHALRLVEGGAGVQGHDLMLSLTSCGIANVTDDLDWLASCLNALLHPNYQGNTRSETADMLKSARRKGLGRAYTSSQKYEPGIDGPIPLGFTKDGQYAFRDQVRNIIVLASANQLLSHQFLLGLSSSKYWASRFPSEKSLFNYLAAGEALIAACKERGPFNPLRVRGRGVWREGSEIVVNLGGAIPSTTQHLYLCFDPIDLQASDPFDVQRVLEHLRRFRWRNPQDALLLLGWLAIAPICGVLSWRPHLFLYGPARCGKTTIHTLAARLLHPLVISTDGQSSEAGIRQTLGPDSLPILIDEFESDQHGAGLRGVLRLARSASSADNPVLRGTPEGKAMQFSLRTSFFFSAVNPGRMSPADQSRILLLEMLNHDGNEEVARAIIAEEAFFRESGPQWCSYMISLAAQVAPALDAFEPAVPSSDRRHRQNCAALLAGAFVALHGRCPSQDEAVAWAAEYAPSVDHHAEEIDRDNSRECLDHLLSYVVEKYPLGHWIALARQDLGTDDLRRIDAERITRIYDIVIKDTDADWAALIRNGSPNVEKVFQNTIWEGRGWERALRALDGAFSLKNPVYFGGSGQKSRCIGIPGTYIPEPIEMIGYGDQRY